MHINAVNETMINKNNLFYLFERNALLTRVIRCDIPPGKINSGRVRKGRRESWKRRLCKTNAKNNMFYE